MNDINAEHKIEQVDADVVGGGVGGVGEAGIGGANTSNASNSSPKPAHVHSRFKTFMLRRTPGINVIKSKFLNVLGSSNEILNGISTKINFAVSISSSESEYCDDDEEIPQFDETIDYTKIDYESRRMKARRAQEEVISGRYRHPNLAPKKNLNDTNVEASTKTKRSNSLPTSSSTSSSSSDGSLLTDAQQGSNVSSTTLSKSLESRHSGGYERRGGVIPGARRSEMDMIKDRERVRDLMPADCTNAERNCIEKSPKIKKKIEKGEKIDDENHRRRRNLHLNLTNPITVVPCKNNERRALSAHSRATHSTSTITSLRDEPDVSGSQTIDSVECRHFVRTESINSLPSWASSMSLDCSSEENPIKEFMKKFVNALFYSPQQIDAEFKTQYNVLVRVELGRRWLVRYLNEQKKKIKRVDETTFHLLVQFFVIALDECNECPDYAPANIIMNLCFLFYREIEVPGCEPYREYLFTYLRHQPIWNNLKYWNMTFFDVVHTDRMNRLSMQNKRLKRLKKYSECLAKAETKQQNGDDNNESSSTSTEHKTSNKSIQSKTQIRALSGNGDFEEEFNETELRLIENIICSQLCGYTCNMHALGVSKENCMDFLKFQIGTYNISKEKIKPLRDNVLRMFHETELWGSEEDAMKRRDMEK